MKYLQMIAKSQKCHITLYINKIEAINCRSVSLQVFLERMCAAETKNCLPIKFVGSSDWGSRLITKYYSQVLANGRKEIGVAPRYSREYTITGAVSQLTKLTFYFLQPDSLHTISNLDMFLYLHSSTPLQKFNLIDSWYKKILPIQSHVDNVHYRLYKLCFCDNCNDGYYLQGLL